MTENQVECGAATTNSFDADVEVSIVMPCLNEAETVARCVEKALGGLRENGIRGEVVIADNGSTDGSQELARCAGARVVAVEKKGYGARPDGRNRSRARKIRGHGRRRRQL